MICVANNELLITSDLIYCQEDQSEVKSPFLSTPFPPALQLS